MTESTSSLPSEAGSIPASANTHPTPTDTEPTTTPTSVPGEIPDAPALIAPPFNAARTVILTAPEQSPGSKNRDKVRRIGFIKRWKTVHALGKLAREHNSNTADTDAQDGGSYRPIDTDAKRNAKTAARIAIQRSNAERRRIIKARISPFRTDASVMKKMKKEHGKAYSKAVKTSHLASGMQGSTFANLDYSERRAASSIAARNAVPGAYDIRVTKSDGTVSFIPAAIADRSVAARLQEARFMSPVIDADNFMADTLPEALKSEEAVLMLRDMRGKLQRAVDRMRQQAAVDRIAFDERGARAQVLKNFTLGNFYKGSGVDTRSPVIVDLLNRFMDMGNEKFEELFPQPQPRSRRGRRGDGEGESDDQPSRRNGREPRSERVSSDKDLRHLQDLIDVARNANLLGDNAEIKELLEAIGEGDRQVRRERRDELGITDNKLPEDEIRRLNLIVRSAVIETHLKRLLAQGRITTIDNAARLTLYDALNEAYYQNQQRQRQNRR